MAFRTYAHRSRVCKCNCVGNTLYIAVCEQCLLYTSPEHHSRAEEPGSDSRYCVVFLPTFMERGKHNDYYWCYFYHTWYRVLIYISTFNTILRYIYCCTPTVPVGKKTKDIDDHKWRWTQSTLDKNQGDFSMILCLLWITIKQQQTTEWFSNWYGRIRFKAANVGVPLYRQLYYW